MININLKIVQQDNYNLKILKITAAFAYTIKMLKQIKSMILTIVQI